VASHAWFRYDPTWDRDEEAGTFLVFADPYVMAGKIPARKCGQLVSEIDTPR